MTQVPPGPLYPHHTPTYAPTGPPPWSGTAIAGFVCSLLGCTGIGALLGLVLGIVGFLDSRGGRRRGLGLAVAAIPISLIFGTAAVLLALFFVKLSTSFLQMPAKVQAALATLDSDPAATAAGLRKLTSVGFNAAVSDEKLATWIKSVQAKHGQLNELEFDETAPPRQTAPGSMELVAKGKFVNGPARIAITVTMLKITSPAIDDIAVDGSSPRDVK